MEDALPGKILLSVKSYPIGKEKIVPFLSGIRIKKIGREKKIKIDTLDLWITKAAKKNDKPLSIIDSLLFSFVGKIRKKVGVFSGILVGNKISVSLTCQGKTIKPGKVFVF